MTVKLDGNALILDGNKFPPALAAEISQLLQRYESGLAPGGLTQRMGTTVGGGDW